MYNPTQKKLLKELFLGNPHISCLLSSSLKGWKPHLKSHISCSLWMAQQLTKVMVDAVDDKSWSTSCLEMQVPCFAFPWKRLECFLPQQSNLSHPHGADFRLLVGGLGMGWRFLSCRPALEASQISPTLVHCSTPERLNWVQKDMPLAQYVKTLQQ